MWKVDTLYIERTDAVDEEGHERIEPKMPLYEDLYSTHVRIEDGEVKVIEEHASLITGLTKQVWTGLIDKKDYKKIKDDFQVISSKLYMGKVQVRLLDDKKPMDDFEQSKPEIEDLYFATINDLDTLGEH